MNGNPCDGMRQKGQNWLRGARFMLSLLIVTIAGIAPISSVIFPANLTAQETERESATHSNVSDAHSEENVVEAPSESADSGERAPAEKRRDRQERASLEATGEERSPERTRERPEARERERMQRERAMEGRWRDFPPAWGRMRGMPGFWSSREPGIFPGPLPGSDVLEFWERSASPWSELAARRVQFEYLREAQRLLRAAGKEELANQVRQAMEDPSVANL